MRLRIIVLTLTFFLTSPAFAQNVDILTIGGMRTACKTQTTSNPNASVVDWMTKGTCAGWVISKMSWRGSACTFKQEGYDVGSFAGKAARRTPGHSVEAMMQAFLNWADKNPQLWSKTLMSVSVNADFWSEFPCD